MLLNRALRWTGFVQPAFSEQYEFTVEANDGARLWIGDNLMFDNFDEVRSVTFSGCWLVRAVLFPFGGMIGQPHKCRSR